MPTLDELIADHLQFAAQSGELRAAPSWGKPMPADDGWEATPVELRMPFKILKDAGFAPPEIAWFRERARLRVAAAAASDPAERARLDSERQAIEHKLALRLESLRLRRAL